MSALQWQSKRGVSLVELVVASLLLGVLAAGVMSLFRDSADVRMKRRWVAQALQVKNNALVLLLNKPSWKSTVKHSSNATSFACLSDVSTCTDSPSEALKVFDAAGVEYFDHSNTSLGFNEHGERCAEFNAATGDDACPFRYEFSWRPICETFPCAKLTQIEVQGAFQFRPKSENLKNILNLENYHIRLVKNLADTMNSWAVYMKRSSAGPLYMAPYPPEGYVFGATPPKTVLYSYNPQRVCELMPVSPTCPQPAVGSTLKDKFFEDPATFIKNTPDVNLGLNLKERVLLTVSKMTAGNEEATITGWFASTPNPVSLSLFCLANGTTCLSGPVPEPYLPMISNGEKFLIKDGSSPSAYIYADQVDFLGVFQSQ